MSPEPFDSRAKAPPAKRWEKGYGDENELTQEQEWWDPGHWKFNISRKSYWDAVKSSHSLKRTKLKEDLQNVAEILPAEVKQVEVRNSAKSVRLLKFT